MKREVRDENEKVRRSYDSEPVELREDAGHPVIAGYAALYDAEVVIGGQWRERIERGAFRSAITGGADIRATFNHNDDIVLARTTNGTLRLFDDERGLRYEFDPNLDDPQALSVIAKIKRGEITQSSFGFIIGEGNDEWARPATRGELPLRRIRQFDRLLDVGPVTYPASKATTAEARSAAQAVMPPDTDDTTERDRLARLRAEIDVLALD